MVGLLMSIAVCLMDSDIFFIYNVEKHRGIGVFLMQISGGMSRNVGLSSQNVVAVNK